MLSRIALAHPVMLHDFMVTEKHMVFFVSPVRIVPMGPLPENLCWTPSDGTEIIVVPLDTPERPIRFHTDAFCQFHFAGAFEDKGEIVVDYVRYADSRLVGALGDGRGLSWTDKSTHVHGTLHRARLDVHKKRFCSEPLWDGYCEYPQIAGQVAGAKYRHIWMQSSRYLDGILRFEICRLDEGGDSRQYLFGPGEICSEPVLAQAAGGCEDDGSVLSLVYDSETARSHVVVLDAQTLALQARVQLSQAIPLTFHGSWLPG